MFRGLRPSWLLPFLLILGLSLGPADAVVAQKPVVVLTAFGTTTAAFDTYRHIEDRVKERFPGYEIRWAFTSGKVRRKVARDQGKNLKNLPETLQELKAAGITRVAVQSLHVVPGQEWQEVVREGGQKPGMKVALGQPLLSGKADEERVLAALGKTFPPDLKNTAVLLVGHGTSNPHAEETYLAFQKLLHSRYSGRNVFLGLVSGNPGQTKALAQVKASGASSVVLVPFLLVAGEHVSTDIMGDGPESWKSRLLAQGVSRVDGQRRGLGYNDEIINVYLNHLQEALQGLKD